MDVGLAGLGRMGLPIARRLLDGGHALSVWNRSVEKAESLGPVGATAVARPADLWVQADVCVTMLADDAALREVALGEQGVLTAAPAEGGLLIDMSTVSPAASEEIARAASEAGVSYLRAPVSGNPTVVEAGNLTIVVSGPYEAFERAEALLRDIGPNVFHVGDGERARVVKLVLNLMIAGTAQLMAEALALGEAYGLDRGTLLEVMGESAVGSPFVKYKTAALLADDYSTTFPSSAMDKDLRLALSAAHDVDLTLPVTGVVRKLLLACIADGHGDDDFISLVPSLMRSRRPPKPGAYM